MRNLETIFSQLRNTICETPTLAQQTIQSILRQFRKPYHRMEHKHWGIYLLCSLAVLHISCDSANKVEEKHIPFEFGEEAPRLLIPVTLQDSIPAKLVFATSYGSPLLDSAFVSQHPSLTPEDIPSQEAEFGSGWNPASITKCILYSDPELETLKLKLGENPMSFGNWTVGNYRKLFGENEVDGITGIPSADSTKVWGFNFENNYITIQEADSFEMPKEYMQFPMKVVTYPAGGMTIHVNLPLKVQTSDGDTVTIHRDFFVDTGAWEDIILTSEASELAFFDNKKDAVWIATPYNGLYTRNHEVKVSLGEYENDSFRVTTYDHKHKTTVSNSYFIGLSFLKHFNVYFDFQRKVMGLKPIPNFERIIDKHARRYHMGFNMEIMNKQQRFIVETIADNKENNYYTAGLRVGDEIISANGILWKDITPEQKETMCQGDYIRFKIIRDGKNMEISVPVNKNEPIGY